MKYWEIIADELSASGWSWGYCTMNSSSGCLFVVDAHNGDDRRFVVYSDELLSAFLELEASLL